MFCSLGLAKTILQGAVKGGKKTRQTEVEVGRQHQGEFAKTGLEFARGKMEETGSEIIRGAPMTLAVKE